MTEELHPDVAWIAGEARRPVALDPAARERLLVMIRAEPVPARRFAWMHRAFEPRLVSLSPVASTLLAAGLVGIGVVAGVLGPDRGGRQAGQPAVAVAPQPPVSDTVQKFVFVAPQAGRVSLVGDFNGWDPSKTPMRRAGKSGLWTVTVPLSAGRHVYAFVVDGAWSPDPYAPYAPDVGFGHANSVRIVPRGSAS